MLVSSFPRVIAAAIIGFILIQARPKALAQSTLIQDAAPPSCHVTLPLERSAVPLSAVRATQVGIGADGKVSTYGTDKLWTMLPTDGVWRGTIPSKPGDFAYSNKLPWGGTFSYKDGPLIVAGKRLDGPAPSFTEVENISWKREFMGGISIPVFGCWAITAHYKDQELSFVVWVTPMSEQKLPPSAVVQPIVPASMPRRIHVDSEVEAESLVYQVAPEIPDEAQRANVSGTVVLHAVVGIDGRPHDLQYVSGSPLLAQAAIDTVTWWQYRINDENVEIDTTIPVVFSTGDH